MGEMAAETCVYVVDDDEAVRDSLSVLLEVNGYTSRAFSSAQEFLAAAPTLRPGCLIADIRMPRMDGAEFFERLQQERPALAERLLFLSGDITHLASRGLAEVPRERVFVKPVELAELERRIAAFVREKAA